MKSSLKRLGRWIQLLTVIASAVGLSPAAQYDQRLINLSSRARISPGDNNALIAGFVVSDGAPKQVMIRAVGPSLAQPGFGLTSSQVLSNPRLELFDRNGTKVLENDNWNTSAGGSVASNAHFDSVGAFRFVSSGSQDAALIATLSPGLYTAKVSGVGTSSGIALVEVYDVTGAAQLINLSTRAQVQSGANLLISGLVVGPGSGVRRLLVRAAGPSLERFQVSGALSDPILTIIDSKNVQVATNDNWSDDGLGTTVAAAMAASGAFPFDSPQSRDAAVVVDLAPGSYTIQVTGVNGASGVALVEVYDMTPITLPSVTVLATAASTDTSGGNPGVFTFTRTGPTTQPLTLSYTLSGSAANGSDFESIPTTITVPAGASSISLPIRARESSASSSPNKAVTLTLTESGTYGLGANASASVIIFYNSGSLYVSTLRPSSSGVQSVAYGASSLQVSSDETFALVSLSFASLSSPQTVAYLRLGSVGDSGAHSLFRIPTGQASGVRWNFRDTGDFTVAEIVQAIKEGRVFVSIETVDYPGGELAGAFVRSSGSLAFTPPPPGPAVNLGNPTSAEAARFLIQSTFGATSAEIERVKALGYNSWITDQINKPASSHRAHVAADFAVNNNGGIDQDSVTKLYRRPGQQHRLNAWWKISLQGEDQLRQRVAFALSQIFVISDQAGNVNGWQEGAANYYDLLAKGAFGNFRQLLQDVSLSPMMGMYLTHLRNRKATSSALPDENYAREVMQLFSIGLNELNPDGTLRLDPRGLPIPTYDQTTIAETAKVFTGWGFAQSASASPSFTGGGGNANPSDYLNPMRLFPAFHDDGAKTIVTGKALPANQGGLADLNDTLDTLFHHPNTGPFICRQLIQRLVTANPSPAYVYRVAQVFANNGAGVRGDLGAVVRALLTDYEARSPEVAATATFGKLKEPLLRTTALFRALNGSTNSGRILLTNSNAQLSQMALSAPTVFNFFEPNYVQPGPLAASGLYAPEFKILTDTTAITITNYLYSYLYANKPTDMTNSTTVYMDFTALLALVDDPTTLVNHLDLLLAGGSTSEATRARIVSALNELPRSATPTERVRSATYLLISTPEGAIQP